MSFQINEYLSVKLIDNECIIHVNDKPFRQCSYILISVPKVEADNDFDCIDQFAEQYSHDHEQNKGLIDKETELFAHASNLQAWYEHDYDTRILHSNLSFPLLKELSNYDPLAKKVYKDEIAYRIASGYPNVILYLIENNYLDIFTNDEFMLLFEENKHVIPKNCWRYLIKNLWKYDKTLMCFIIQGLAINVMIKTRDAARAAAWDDARAAARDAWAAARDARAAAWDDAWAAARAAAWDDARAAARDAWAAARDARAAARDARDARDAWAAARDARAARDAWAAARDAWAAARDAWAAAWDARAAAWDDAWAAAWAAWAAARDARAAARDAAWDDAWAAAKIAFRKTMSVIWTIIPKPTKRCKT